MEKEPFIDLFLENCPALDPPQGGVCRKDYTQVRDYDYFISIKFRKHQSSGSVGKADYVFQYIYNPTPCSCCDSEVLYAPCGDRVTADLSIVRYQKLKDVLRKGPKYREPVSFSWHQNFNITMDACEEYARRWAKKEDVEVDTLSEWAQIVPLS